jgi:hypothetical protein
MPLSAAVAPILYTCRRHFIDSINKDMHLPLHTGQGLHNIYSQQACRRQTYRTQGDDAQNICKRVFSWLHCEQTIEVPPTGQLILQSAQRMRPLRESE